MRLSFFEVGGLRDGHMGGITRLSGALRTLRAKTTSIKKLKVGFLTYQDRSKETSIDFCAPQCLNQPGGEGGVAAEETGQEMQISLRRYSFRSGQVT